MAEKTAKACGTLPVPIRCAACPMMKLTGWARRTDNNDYLSRPRGVCYCGHEEADAAFKLILPRASRATSFIAFTKGDTDGPDIKTAPRWCPRKIASEPRRISREEAKIIIESRHVLLAGERHLCWDRQPRRPRLDRGVFHEANMFGLACG